ncbi:hypothetical protein FOI42_RS03500 [Escherichia coli]|nr:hypothetical protein [Escherichia coli]MED6699375.1 hypothetical protein [Escherichia coli O157]HCQ0858616.1 hypothetical protein [Escherichia coli]
MLDILGNIDTVNFFIQDAIINITSKPIQVRSNFYSGDGYMVDIVEVKKNVFQINILTQTRTQISRIIINKDEAVIRYNSKFMMFFKKKTGMFSTNLFDESFYSTDVESTFFTQSTFIKFDSIEFDSNIMSETLQCLKVLHNEFTNFIDSRNKIN